MGNWVGKGGGWAGDGDGGRGMGCLFSEEEGEGIKLGRKIVYLNQLPLPGLQQLLPQRCWFLRKRSPGYPLSADGGFFRGGEFPPITLESPVALALLVSKSLISPS